tara:strand:+ start:895 stop:1278 length:384 start_codon:yes stop_codon:yes gene_type:complete
MKIKTINTIKAPQAIGPYSQAKVINNLVFTSGQIPLQPNGELVTGNFEKECVQVLENLKAILDESNSNLSNIIKLTVFLTDINKFNTLNDVFERYFVDDLPARSTIEVSKLPKGCRVEIEAVGLVDV